jgi:hypothetical protein
MCCACDDGIWSVCRRGVSLSRCGRLGPASDMGTGRSDRPVVVSANGNGALLEKRLAPRVESNSRHEASSGRQTEGRRVVV